MSRIAIRESMLRRWASVALLLTVWMAAERRDADTVGSGSQIWRDMAAIAISVVVLGFYLQMLIECVSNKTFPRKWLWFIFLLALPVVSGFVYFMYTRSSRSEALAADGMRGSE